MHYYGGLFLAQDKIPGEDVMKHPPTSFPGIVACTTKIGLRSTVVHHIYGK